MKREKREKKRSRKKKRGKREKRKEVGKRKERKKKFWPQCKPTPLREWFVKPSPELMIQMLKTLFKILKLFFIFLL